MRLRPPTFTEFQTLGDKLSLGQRAFAAVAYDGLEPRDLPLGLQDRGRRLFGNVETVPPECRRVLVQAKGRDVGGTRLSAEYVVLLGATAPIVGPSLHELVFCFLGGPKLRHARVALRFARDACRHHRIKVIDESSDGFTMVRPDGRKIRYECFAASRGGDNIRGVPILAAVLTEAAFYLDALTGVANGEAIFGAILPRLLRGGKIIIESTVWAESGLLHQQFTQNFGHPETALAAHCPTRLMRDDAETQTMIALEEKRDAMNAARELGAEFLPLGSSQYLDSAALNDCLDESVPATNFPFGVFRTVVAGFDAGYQRDGSAGVIAVETNDRTKAFLPGVIEWNPRPGAPLVPSMVNSEFAILAKRCGARLVAADSHYSEAIREQTRRHGLYLLALPAGNHGKAIVYSAARDFIHGGRVRWNPKHERLTRQLREVYTKPLPGGLMAISSPRRKGEHGDIASACCAALWLLQRRRGGGATESPTPAQSNPMQFWH